MNNKIKIAIIAVIAVAICAAIFFFAGGLSKKSELEKPVATTDFEKKIQTRVDKEIKDKDYAEASRAYTEIMGLVDTEASITLGDGSKKLGESEAKKCRQMLFYEFAPIFCAEANNYLKTHTWADAQISALRTEAKSLQAMGFAEAGTETAKTFARVVKTADEYFAAWALARSASSATTPEAINSLKSRANQYRHEPLTNCTALISALNNIPAVARASVSRNVAANANAVAARCTSYGSYQAWMVAHDNAETRISGYASAFGSLTAELQNAYNALVGADRRALEYYTSRPSTSSTHSGGNAGVASADDEGEDDGDW